ncbi:MAG: Asp-tRNA(Asn)/Glu-tRNA(Gln) amidotransferase GatCAB subunit C [Crocinitomicaceae bacterium]|nr:Asp-tRNA(Asn)/Glu-tRNA(Gln) amidotransferase GatCAB subunit C [Crocinitomicaceae bacterium]|tara:strand:+ start:15595 stop:15888 length:294 start_codon:yes stop_codon:yes gene_type:complete
MEINNDLIDKLSALAKLEFEGEDKEVIKADLTKMLGFVEKLNNVDTEGVEPLIYMTDEESVMREDVAQSVISQEEALKNAPQKDSYYFKVPKVLKKG